VRSALAGRAARLPPRGEAARLAEVGEGAGGEPTKAVRLLRDELAAVLAWSVLDTYARAHRSVSSEDAAAFVAKAAAAVVGRAVGDAIRRTGRAPARELLEGI
jgi:3-phosphoglycerate kinase